MTVNPVDSRVFILDDKGKVHIYEPTLTPFVNRGNPPSEDTYMDIISLKDRVTLNETIPLWTWFRALVLPVKKVAIKRVRPDHTEEYLQDDLSWNAAYSYFSGEPIKGKLPENSWEDFRFYTEFDQLGQWDFYCEVNFIGIKTVTTLSKTGVMCESLQALKSYDVGIGDDIFFDKENDLCISNGNAYTKHILRNDVFVTDFKNQQVFLRNNYDEIEVVNG